MTHIRYAHLVWALLGLLVLNGCATLGLDPEITVNTPPSNTFQVDKKQESQKFASAEFIKTLSKEKLFTNSELLKFKEWREVGCSGKTLGKCQNELRDILSGEYLKFHPLL